MNHDTNYYLLSVSFSKAALLIKTPDLNNRCVDGEEVINAKCLNYVKSTRYNKFTQLLNVDL